MHVIVHGTGAVGGYFGARLALGGATVTLVARGANLDALRTRGLVLRMPAETLAVRTVRAVGDPAEAGPADLILVCVKSYDTAAAATALRRVVRPDTIVLSLQNGIENEAVLAAGLGLPPLMIGLTRIGVELTAPGEVTYSGRGTIVFGEPDGRESARARRLADAFAAAHVSHQLRADVLVAAWEKLAWNAAFNALTTLTQATVAEAVADPGSRDLLVRAIVEVDAVAVAHGVPVRRGRIDDVLRDSVDGLPDFPTSMLQDLRRGKRLEHDGITGAVVRHAANTGVPVPLNRALLALLARLDPGRRAVAT